MGTFASDGKIDAATQFWPKIFASPKIGTPVTPMVLIVSFSASACERQRCCCVLRSYEFLFTLIHNKLVAWCLNRTSKFLVPLLRVMQMELIPRSYETCVSQTGRKTIHI